MRSSSWFSGCGPEASSGGDSERQKLIQSAEYSPPDRWLLIALVIPLAFGTNQYAMVLVTTVLLYAILASAWNIIGGMAGQLDLAAAAYLGLGAFTTGTLLIRWNITPWMGMIVGGLVATGLAMLIGFPLFGFKIKELWYALSSSALVVVMQSLFMMWNAVGGPPKNICRLEPRRGTACASTPTCRITTSCWSSWWLWCWSTAGSATRSWAIRSWRWAKTKTRSRCWASTRRPPSSRRW